MAQTTSSGGVTINYEDLGQGDLAILLMPAWCQSHSVFADLPSKCAANRRTLVIDWRGHGQSENPTEDFGAAELVDDAIAVIEASGAKQVVPVSTSHSGWIGIELRRKLGDKIPKLIHTDWLVVPPPPEYMGLVKALNDPNQWDKARDQLFAIWLEGEEENQALVNFVRGEMGAISKEMWLRSGREIGGCYERGGSPLEALSSLDPNIPVLHIYAQPGDPGYLKAQEDFGSANPWFNVHKLDAHSHFPTFEVPDAIAATIEKFVSS